RGMAAGVREGSLSVFQCLPLLRHALFPSGFRHQVNRMTQEHPSGLLLTAPGIQHRVPRRTLSKHTALQWSVLREFYILRDPRPRRSPGVDRGVAIVADH